MDQIGSRREEDGAIAKLVEMCTRAGL